MEKTWFKTVAIFLFCLGAGNCELRALTTNSWISATSANWEDAGNWSLGVPPAEDQVILITNAGWKAVGINPSTANNAPQTMSAYSVLVSSPAESFNELLLNYSGFDVPLALHGFYIQSNAAVVALYSAVQVTPTTGPGGFAIGGLFMQGESSEISADTMTIGDLGPGAYYLTNGTLSVLHTQFVGGAFTASFNQFGGSNTANPLRLQSGSQYTIQAGTVAGSIVIGNGNFYQEGGTMNATGAVAIVQGSYTLSGGVLNTPGMEVPSGEPPVNGPSQVLQIGGTNNCSQVLNIGTYMPPVGLAEGSYTLSNGVLVAGGISVGGYGDFSQRDGNCQVNGAISMTGANPYLNTWYWGGFGLGGGNVSANGIAIGEGSFSQSGGSNALSGNLAVGPTPVHATYTLSGGLLITSNSIVRQDNLFEHPITAGFLQSGGTHQIDNLLQVSGTSRGFYGYILAGGTLSAQNLEVDTGAVFDHRDGSLHVSGLVTLANGTWLCNTGRQVVGELMLGVSEGNNSTLSMPAGSCVLHFANSSNVVWSNAALLTIQNWNGSPGGGGNDQIFFGTNSAGLSAQQLAQVQFHNPNGLSGMFPAAILADGEVVPARLLVAQRNGSQLVLEWASPTVLQSATNVAGPYQDVSGAASPYSVQMNLPARFFRLRQ